MKSQMLTGRLLASALVAAGLTGCRTFGPEFHTPHIAAPATFQSAPGQAGTADSSDPKWWTVFRDPTLDALQAAALEHSPTLAMAFARVEEARAKFGIARADTKLATQAGGAARIIAETAEREIPVPGRSLTFRERGDSYRAGVDAGFELDLWGRVKRSLESAKAQVMASEADRRAVELVLTAEVAQAYFAQRTADALAEILNRTLASRRDAVAVLMSRSNAGLAPELDLNRARVEVATLEAELAELQRRRGQAANAVAFLTGRLVTSLNSIESQSVKVSIPEIPPGLPSELLRRRPDVAASEANFRARNAEIGIAEAARFPAIRLTGSAGFESLELGSLLGRPSQFWAFGPSFNVPLFDGGRSRAAVDVARARAAAAAADYQQNGLAAFREVEDALVELRQEAEQAAAQRKAAESAAEVIRLATLRYEGGFASYLEVVDAQRTALQIERAQTEIEGARFASTVRLIRALGGGWNSFQTTPTFKTMTPRVFAR